MSASFDHHVRMVGLAGSRRVLNFHGMGNALISGSGSGGCVLIFLSFHANNVTKLSVDIRYSPTLL